MIPPDVLARAREAFTEAGGGHAGLEAALSVLSAAWPVADGRRPSPDLTEEQWTRFRDHLRGLGWVLGDNLDAIRAALWAALSPPSAPAADVRIVRVAVAQAEDGSLLAYHVFDSGPPETWRTLADDGYPIRLCIAEIPVPIRDVPTVRASVEAPHG